MDYSEAARAIESRFSQNWENQLPVAWENLDYVPTPGHAFVRAFVLENDSFQTSIGSTPCVRNLGRINIQVWTPANTGTRAGRDYAVEILSYFRCKAFDGVVCDSGLLVNMGIKGEWHRFVVSVGFHFDSLVTA